MEDRDEMLVRRLVAEDDAEAFSALVGHHAGMVYGTCRRVLGSDAQAADAVQETFFQLLKEAHRIRGSVAGWLHQVATRRAVDIVRRDISRRRREEQYAASLSNESASWEGLEPLVDEALEELPEDLRELLILYYLNGQTTTEIAAAKGVAQSTISRHVASALDTLRRKLRARGVVVGLTVLAGLMANSAEAAPPSLLRSLGKIALVKAASPGAGILATTAKCLSTAGLKVAVAGVGVLLLAATGYVVARRSAASSASPVPAAASAADTAGVVEKDSRRVPEQEASKATPSAPGAAAPGTDQGLTPLVLISNSPLPARRPAGGPPGLGGATFGAGSGGTGNVRMSGTAGGFVGGGGSGGGFMSGRGSGGSFVGGGGSGGTFRGGGGRGMRAAMPPLGFGPTAMRPNAPGGTGFEMSFGMQAAAGSGASSFSTNFGFMRTMTYSNGMTWETQRVFSSGSSTPPAPAR